MEVKTTDYSGRDRRNGSKLKLSISDYLKVLTIGFSLLVAGITFYINTNNITSVLAKDVEISKEADKKQDEAIIIIKGDIKYIREDMADMKVEQSIINAKLDEGNKVLYKILGALESK